MESATSAPRHRIHVGALRQRLGQRLDVDVDTVLGGLKVIATETTDEPVTGTLTVESIERGVSVTGSLRVEWTAECRRCLDRVTGVVDALVDEIFQVDAPPDSDIIDFDGDTIVLDDVIRESALAALPLAPLCGSDCDGPAPDRYRPGLHGRRAGDSDTETRDPRWAALDQLDL